MSKFIFNLIPLVLIAQVSVGQQSIKAVEAAQIRYTAEQLVTKDLLRLMNSISNTEWGSNEIQTISTSSYRKGFSQIFDSSTTIVADDIHPSATQESAYTNDVKVKEYLEHLDVSYVKSPGASIIFTLVKVSNVKRFDRNTYVKVYYTSFFRNSNKTIDTPYSITNRVAEVVVRKADNQWVPAISRIKFFIQKDTVQDIENDLLVERDIAGQALDSTALAQQQKTYDDELREKNNREMIEKNNRLTDQYSKLINEGDIALTAKDYTEALKKYSQAKQLKEYDRLAYAKIDNLQKEQTNAQKAAGALYEQLVNDARRAAIRRDYKQALEFFRSARQQDPQKAASFEKEYRDLNTRYTNLEKMEELYKIGKYKEAITQYNDVIKKNKEFSDYYVGLARCYEMVNEDAKAERNYKTAIEKDPDNFSAYFYKAFLLKRKQNYVDAIMDHRKCILLYNENPTNYLELSELRVSLNQRKDAISILEEGLSVPSLQKTAELYLKKGLLLADDRSWKNAINDFTSVVRIDSNNAFGYYNRGLSLLQLGQIDNASYDFESARQKGLDSQYIRQVAFISEGYFDRAELKSNSNAIDSALSLVSSAISINPYNDKFRYYKGEYFFAQRKYTEAIRYYDQALVINKLHTDAHYRRGLAYSMLNDHKTAVESFKNALSLNFNYIAPTKSLGDSYFALKDYISATTQYENAIKLLNNQKANNDVLLTEIYNSLGKSYYYTGYYEKSVASLRSAIRKNERFAEAYFNRGLSYYEWNKREEAIADFNKAVELQNNIATWNYYRAKAHQEDGKHAEAASYFTSTITLDSSHKFANAPFLRGNSYYALKDYQSALPDYIYALKNGFDTASSTFNFQLGTIYMNLVQPDSALVYFKKQYAVDSTDGSVALGIGTAYVQKGSPAEAMPWLDKVLKAKTATPRQLRNNKMIAAIQEDKDFKAMLKKY